MIQSRTYLAELVQRADANIVECGEEYARTGNPEDQWEGFAWAIVRETADQVHRVEVTDRAWWIAGMQGRLDEVVAAGRGRDAA